MMIGKQACPPVSLLTALAFTLAVSAVRADVRLPALFGDNGVSEQSGTA